MLIDVTPLTLGVETDGGVFSPVMDRGTAVPWKAPECSRFFSEASRGSGRRSWQATKVFTTSADAQDAIEAGKVQLQGKTRNSCPQRLLNLMAQTNNLFISGS